MARFSDGGREGCPRGKSPADAAPSPPISSSASASPRRRELLERLGLALEVAPATSTRRRTPGEKPLDYARRVAAAKCDAVADGAAAGRGLAVLGADTTVVVEDAILGKPADDAEARAMLARLAGRRHEVITAYRSASATAGSSGR